MSDELCPWCGAYSRRSCEMEEDMGFCPWDEPEPDPDILRAMWDAYVRETAAALSMRLSFRLSLMSMRIWSSSRTFEIWRSSCTFAI